MAAAAIDGERASSPNRRQSLVYLAIYTSLFIPLACIPYIPIRRHLLGLKKSIHVLSNNTNSLQHELNTSLLQARILREEKLQHVEELRDFQYQLDAIKAQATQAESDRLHNDSMTMKRLEAVRELTAREENFRLRVEEELRRQTGVNIERDRLPVEIIHDMSTSLADVASFIEEVEIQQGWSQSIPRDRGVDRMRQLALKLHAIAKAKPTYGRDA